MRLNPHPKQAVCLEYLLPDSKRKREVVFGGGARGGKSWLGWEWLTHMCLTYPGVRYFVGRDELKRLRSTTLMTFFKVTKHHKVTAFNYNAQDHYIGFGNGSRIDLLELRYYPSDPMYERFGSSEYTGGWIEEGGEIEFGCYDVLKTRIGQHLNDKYDIPPKLLITCNPKKNWLYTNFYRPHSEGRLEPHKAFVQSLYRDNIYREASTESQLDSLASEAQKQRLMYGNWDYEDDPEQLITWSMAETMWDVAHIAGEKALGVDVARSGDDSSCIAVGDGNRVMDIRRIAKYDTVEVALVVKSIIETERVNPMKVGIDTVGLGAGTFDYLKHIGLHCTEVVSGASATSIDTAYNFKNLRSQMWWEFREALLSGEVSMGITDPKLCEMLKEDLTAPRYKIVGERMIQVESKDDIKKRLGRSTDLGDCVVYWYHMRGAGNVLFSFG
jgi:phage terminase large subunit